MTQHRSLHGAPVCLNTHAEHHDNKAREEQQQAISVLDVTSLDLTDKYALTRVTLHSLQRFLDNATCDPQTAVCSSQVKVSAVTPNSNFSFTFQMI